MKYIKCTFGVTHTKMLYVWYSEDVQCAPNRINIIYVAPEGLTTLSLMHILSVYLHRVFVTEFLEVKVCFMQIL